MTQQRISQDRVVGSMLGLAAGDALGAGYEFARRVPADPQMIGGGLGNWDPGEWTDDTQMAICIAEVTATGHTTPDAIGDRFLSWYRGGPADVGIQTSAVLSAAETGADLTSIAARHFQRNPRSSAGNGSLMRTAPIALAHLGDDEAIAHAAMEISLLTHGDPLAGEACILWCIAIDRAIRYGRLDGVHDGLALLPERSRELWAANLQDAETQPPSTFTPNGFVVTALQAAHAAITQTLVPDEQPCRHLQDALAAAVKIGNDTDTVAAIAGGLLGARWGASAVPTRWRWIMHGWPGYGVRDLTRLALSSADPQVDDRAWPNVQKMVAGYRASYPKVRGVSVALPDDPDVTIGDVAALADTDADLVVSLCRVGSADVPDGRERLEVWLIDDASQSSNSNLDFVLTDTVALIAAARDAGKTVFLHCVAAESRTPTVAAGYLADRLGISATNALKRVQDILPEANPNSGFRDALDRIWPGASPTS